MEAKNRVKEQSRLTKDEWRVFTKTVWQIPNVSHESHPAVFPEEIPRRLVKMFSFVGETVLDPFAGTGTTAAAAVALGRNAICVEQNGSYVRLMGKRFGPAKPKDAHRGLVTVVEADSRDLSFIDSASVSLVVTSPPYWNKANYGRSTRNIGSVANYRRFLAEIKPVFSECLRVLEPGRKLCVVTANVNQHTNHGLLTFPLASDFIQILRQEGFVLVNELVWSKDATGGRWGSWGSQRPIFGSYPYPPNLLFKNVHEFIIIAAKPPQKATKGPRAIDYAQTMHWSPSSRVKASPRPAARQRLRRARSRKASKPG